MSTSLGSTVSSTFSRAASHALSYDSPTSTSSPLSDGIDVDSSGFIESRHRAGGPYLCSIPFQTTSISKDYNRRYQVYDNEPLIWKRVRTILNEEGIPFREIYIAGRLSKVDPEPEPVPTVVVRTENCPRRVARRIYESLVPRLSRISVDMISDELMRPYYLHPVPTSESLYPKWVSLCRQMIRACKQTGTVSQWASIECWKYGPDEENNVAILFQVGRIVRQVHGPILRATDLSQSVRPGVSLGIHSCSGRSYTLGGLIEIRHRDEQSWHSYALTCFHCVWAPREHRYGFRHIEVANAGEYIRASSLFLSSYSLAQCF